MQKQRMNRVASFIASIGEAFGFTKLRNVEKTPPLRKKKTPWGNTGNPDGFGMALLSSPHYRNYKRKRNRRARAANGGVLPKKFA